mgnify:FL=1
MNMNEKDIDHLTRKLMRGTAEQPSASLNSRIMALIIQEKKRYISTISRNDLHL